ncbi:MAG: hypothetical protein GY786_02830 [Proteobacteria bacterium]|nr:hypothetical protein [Pseudomonadota bacterium]
MNRFEHLISKKSLFLNKEAVTSLKYYTTKNAADTSHAVVSKKVMAGLRRAIPIRVTEVPFIKKVHSINGNGVISRRRVKTLSNCEACHVSASAGLYFENHVFISK